jgi:hypothetical protein
MGQFRQCTVRAIAAMALIGGFIGGSAVVLAGAGAASAQSTGVSIVLPSSGATLSGSQYFDAVPYTSYDLAVLFELTSPTGPCSSGTTGPCSVGEASATWVGWAVQFNTENVPNGTYSLTVTVYPVNAPLVTATIPVTVSNPGPTVVLPTNNSTVSGNQWIDCIPSSTSNSGAQFLVEPATPGSAIQELDGRATWIGWLAEWNTSLQPNGVYQVSCGDIYPEGGGVSSPIITVTVANS